MKAAKAVQFRYVPTEQTHELLVTFRMMVNHAIRFCIEENIKGRYKLRNRIYREFRERYGVASWYPYSVAEVTWSIVKKHRRWQRKPVAGRLTMKLEAEGYSLNYSIFSIPFKTSQPRLLIPLQYGGWQRSFLMDRTLKRGSVTMTECAIVIAFSKETAVIDPLRKVGYDLNHKSIVGSDGARIDLSSVARLHTEYGVRRSEFYAEHPNDRRLSKKFAGSRREKERVRQALNVVSKQIVDKAVKNRETIVLEQLKGIRKAHRKGNGKGTDSRRRANLWPFRVLQQQITYKAAWAGVQIEFVNPRNTSKECSNCHYVYRKLRLTERSWLCPHCGCQLERDLNAAVNIERRGKIPCLAVVRPGAGGRGSGEGEREQPAATLVPGADASKLGEGRAPKP